MSSQETGSSKSSWETNSQISESSFTSVSSLSRESSIFAIGSGEVWSPDSQSSQNSI